MKPLRLIFFLGFILTAPLTLLAETNNVQEVVEARRAELQAELEAEERAIAAQTLLLQAKQKERATLQGEVDLLKNQIREAETRIKAKKLAISRLAEEIRRRELRIEELQGRVNRAQESLGELLRQIRDNETFSLVEVVLAAEQLTDFFKNVDDFEFVQKALHHSFAEIRQAQAEAGQEKARLAQQEDEELDAKKTIEYQQKLIAQKEKEKNQLLKITKNQEKNYRNILQQRQKRAAEIRSALFALRDTAPIPFDQALAFAGEAGSKTGVRPALLLAVLKQESNLGENVGTCNRAGDPPRKKWRAIMKPSRDHAPYLRITSELGLDPNNLPLSCPQANGFGGAMGPAQFIPSTWEKLKGRIASFLGKLIPNPFEPRDAFMAAAVYLSDLGAAAKSYSVERNAACLYFSGRRCGRGRPANSFYGDQVMAHAENIQLNMIEPLQNL